MAHKNAESLVTKIPKCVAGCFHLGVGATGCDDTDYDCWCYDDHHQTIVDTMYECLANKERKTNKNCTDTEMHDMELSYWKICEQYWEPYGTASEPASTSTKVSSTSTSSSSTSITSSTEVSTSEVSTSTRVETTSSSTSISTELPETTFVSTTAEASATAANEPPSEALASGNTQSHHLSTGGKAGVAVGVVLGVALIAAAIFMWFRERRKRRGLEIQLVEVQEAAMAKEAMHWEKSLYEMEGDRPRVEELRAAPTPELSTAALITQENQATRPSTAASHIIPKPKSTQGTDPRP